LVIGGRGTALDLVVGVDGGNSKTFALVADTEGHILGFGQTGGSNHEGVGFAEAEERLRQAAHAALSSAGAGGIAAVGFWGLAGADLPSDYERFDTILPRINAAERNIVKNDTVAAMGAGFTRGWGVGIISGAGFNAGGIAPDGRDIQYMGMGFATGDWGGAWNIGPEMVRIAYRGEDGREQPTVLTGLVAHALGLQRMADIALRVRAETLNEEEIRQKLPPLLFEAAYDGDEVACDLVTRVGEEIGVTANTIIRQLGMERLDVEVVLGGSIFKGKGPLLLDVITARVHRAAPRAQIIIPEFDPVVGAVFQALRYVGIDAGEQVRENVRATLPPELVRTVED
jgi:N-acetylglucosamine kinase-like BadF-type ATPase